VTKQNILIVESDEKSLQTIANRILLAEGFNPLLANDQESGVKTALSESPDLLLVHLPLDAASALLARIADARYPIAAILIVQQTSAQIGVELLRLGVKDYIAWPFHREEVLQAINRVLKQQPDAASIQNNIREKLHLEFADMASHLMRNPLSVIQTSIRCLQTLRLNDQEEHELLEKMWRQSRRLNNFTNELLKTLRLESEGTSVCTASVALPPLVERVVDSIKNEKPDLTFSLPRDNGGFPLVAADAVKTEMILLNLLISAIRRCNAGCNISIFIEPNISELIVSIKDNGKPIPVKPLTKVFQSFYPVGDTGLSVPSTYQLGLHSTKRLVEMQNGRIWAEKNVEQGSQFSFSLPIWKEIS